MTTTTAPIFMLKGDALVEFVNEKMQLVNRNEMTRTEMILDAGYVYDNGKAMYTAVLHRTTECKRYHAYH
jgi:hypothetical protein